MFLNATAAKICISLLQLPNYEPAYHCVYTRNTTVLGKFTLNCIWTHWKREDCTIGTVPMQLSKHL